MDLKFVAQQKPATVNAAVQRRQRLVTRIDQQLDLMRSAASASKPRSLWAWMDEGGTYFLPIKYGRHALELKKGMFSIQCKDTAECIGALEAVRGMVLAGEYDQQLAKVSTEIRSRFSG